ncbi:MAG: ankyrin repeat domain-containing protein, partial [Spirochaetales bacterium]|nr:ankyrin repeat domain-containing protein [Spirochaetales bacterium]
MKKTVLITTIVFLPALLWATGTKETPVTAPPQSSASVGELPPSADDPRLLKLAESGDADAVEKLLKVDVNLDEPGVNGRTALHAAAEAGDGKIIQILLARGAAVDPLDDLGQTPLYLAIGRSHTQSIALLADAGGNPAQEDLGGSSPATLLLERDATLIHAALRTSSVNTALAGGKTLLHLAAERGLGDHIEALLAVGANPALRDEEEKTALDALLAGSVTTAKADSAARLIRAGSPAPSNPLWAYIEPPLSTGDLTMRFDYGSTALHIAAERGHEGMVDYFIRQGADVEARDQPGSIPLHGAVRKGYRSIATLLLKAGSPVDARDYNGNAPIHESLTAADGAAMTALLLDQGANPNTKNGSGSTPLHLSVMLDVAVEIPQLLLDRGAEVDRRDRTGNTPLLLAVDARNQELSHLFLEKGADIFAQNTQGETPAENALALGTETVSWFFDSKRLATTDNEGRSVLHLAVAKKTNLD